MNCVWVQNVLLPSEELHLKAARGHTEDVLESLLKLYLSKLIKCDIITFSLFVEAGRDQTTSQTINKQINALYSSDLIIPPGFDCLNVEQKLTLPLPST